MTRRVHFASSIEEIGREAWDALAGEEILANYGWLLTLETAQPRPRRPMYWWIEDQDGILAAVAARLRDPGSPAWNIDKGRYGLLAYVIRPLRSLVQRRPTLVCGAQMSPGQPIVARPGLSAETYHALASELLDTIESHCRTKRWKLVFRGIVEPDEALRGVFAGRPYIVGAESPGSVIDIRWDSWSDYLKDLKTTHPRTEKSIRQQVNRARRGGVVIEELTGTSVIDAELHRILADHHFRKNRQHFYMSPQFTSSLKKNLGDRAVILVARKNDRIVGVSIYLCNSTAMHLKFVGIAEDMVRVQEAVYFNLAYHQVIGRACTEGFRQLYLGILAYQPKTARGARLVPTESWIWAPGRVRAGLLRSLLSYQARRQERAFAPFSQQNRTGRETAAPCYKWPPRSRKG